MTGPPGTGWRRTAREPALSVALVVVLAAGLFVLLGTRSDHAADSVRPPASHELRAAASDKPRPAPYVTFPNPSNTGVPAGWRPAQTVSADMTVATKGAVIEDYRFADGAKLHIAAPGVIVRDSEFQGGMIDTSEPGVRIEHVTMDRASPETTGGEGAISYCGYTAVRVAILDRNEGFRDGCSVPTHIRDSFVRITPPAGCGDWHGDGIQGYTGGDLHVTGVTIDFRETNGCVGNAPFFFPGGQGNSTAHVDGLLVRGGGYPFRMGTPGSVRGLRVVQGPGPVSWRYGPVSVAGDGGTCSAIRPWDAATVDVDAAWTVTKVVHRVVCN